jgi:hypothetical protein
VNVETITHAFQFILAHVVMVSSCAILVGGMLTLHGGLNDHLRALAKEQLKLLRGTGGSLGPYLEHSGALQSRTGHEPRPPSRRSSKHDPLSASRPVSVTLRAH